MGLIDIGGGGGGGEDQGGGPGEDGLERESG